jgi:hypothetical protein
MRTWTQNRGQSLVEFALAVPLLLILAIGIFEAARYVMWDQALNHAVSEGARYAIVHGEDSDLPSGPLPTACPVAECDAPGDNIKARVVDSALGLVSTGDVTIHWSDKNAFTPPNRDDVRGSGDPSDPYVIGYAQRGDHVSVFVTYDYDSIFSSVFGLDFVPQITINAEETLVVNY